MEFSSWLKVKWRSVVGHLKDRRRKSLSLWNGMAARVSALSRPPFSPFHSLNKFYSIPGPIQFWWTWCWGWWVWQWAFSGEDPKEGAFMMDGLKWATVVDPIFHQLHFRLRPICFRRFASSSSSSSSQALDQEAGTGKRNWHILIPSIPKVL
jgi:hypothetical protein